MKPIFGPEWNLGRDVADGTSNRGPHDAGENRDYPGWRHDQDWSAPIFRLRPPQFTLFGVGYHCSSEIIVAVSAPDHSPSSRRGTRR